MSRLLQTKITLLFSCHPSYQTELRVQNYLQETQECKAPSSFTNAVSLGDEGARVTTWVDWTTLKEPSPDLLTLEAKSCGANNHKSSSQHFNTRPIAGEKKETDFVWNSGHKRKCRLHKPGFCHFLDHSREYLSLVVMPKCLLLEVPTELWTCSEREREREMGERREVFFSTCARMWHV